MLLFVTQILIFNHPRAFYGDRTKGLKLRKAKFYLPRQAAAPQQALLLRHSRRAAVGKSLYFYIRTIVTPFPERHSIHRSQKVHNLLNEKLTPLQTKPPRLDFESFYTVSFLCDLFFFVSLLFFENIS